MSPLLHFCPELIFKHETLRICDVFVLAGQLYIVNPGGGGGGGGGERMRS